MTKKTTDLEKLSLNDAYKRLEEITTKIEDETIDLEESIPLLKEGLELAKLIKARLTAIENQIEEVKGKYSTDETSELDEESDEFSF
jgi:exodeoxyribonuclease VII small subunit